MEIDAKSSDGNAFSIMGHVLTLLKETDRMDEWPGFQERMLGDGYDNLCDVAEEATYGVITVVNRPDKRPD